MPSPKIATPLRLLERFVEEGAFFGYFLCTSKESNSPQGESFAPKADTSEPYGTQRQRTLGPRFREGQALRGNDDSEVPDLLAGTSRPNPPSQQPMRLIERLGVPRADHQLLQRFDQLHVAGDDLRAAGHRNIHPPRRTAAVVAQASTGLAHEQGAGGDVPGLHTGLEVRIGATRGDP